MAKKIKIEIPKIKIYGIDVIKNLLFFILYIFITILAFAIIISPSIKTFKKRQKTFYKIKSEYLREKNIYNEALTSLNKAKIENRTIVLKFKRDFDEKNFKKFSSKFMTISKIEKNKTEVYKQDFIKTTYFIDSSIKTPKDFYDFVDGIKNYKNVIKVYFPINFTKNKKNIDLTIKIEHFQINLKNKISKKIKLTK